MPWQVRNTYIPQRLMIAPGAGAFSYSKYRRASVNVTKVVIMTAMREREQDMGLRR